MSKAIRGAVLGALLPGILAAQESVQIARATEMVVPTVPAFALLDVNPAAVARPGFGRDFNLDLLVRDNGLAPDIALEARPVWIFAFDDVSQADYQGASPLARLLSTLSLSVGTAVQDEGTSRLAWSAKLSVLRKDPLLDTGYNTMVSEALDISEEEQELLLAREDELADAASDLERGEIVARYAARIGELEDVATREVLTAVKQFQSEHWNATGLDIAFGQIFRYQGDGLTDLEFDDAGFGGWIAFGTGLGTDNWQLGLLGRLVDVDDDLDRAIGANVRYGGVRANFFVEFVHQWSGPGGDAPLIAYGGEIRLDNERRIEFGLRTVYDENFSLSSVRPAIKLDWKFGGMNLGDVLGL